MNSEDSHKTPLSSTKIVLPSGGFRNLIAYRKSDVIVEGTAVFCRRFLPMYYDRTVDQMNQAARSCKQNIVEGSSSSAVSKETEIKLTNVARATLDELAEDYRDYLKKNGLIELPFGDSRKDAMKTWCREHNDWTEYQKAFEEKDAETLCNLMLTLIYQERFLITRMLEAQESEFKRSGDIRDRMRTARQSSLASAWTESVYQRLNSAQSVQELDVFAQELNDFIKRKSWAIKKRKGWA